MIPDRIGRYQVQSVLGAGGFATVFLAHDPDLDAWVAIKVLADNMSRDEDFRERFVREARVMRQLETPGLVTVYDIGDHQGAPYFVMEYCERGTLADRIEALGRPLTVTEGYQLAAAIAACTGHIHRAGMVHRDLKPSNYLIRSLRHAVPGHAMGGGVLGTDEELAVADFGLAKVIDLNASGVSIAGGTPGYSAPEQFRGDPSVDASADVYAASAMIAAALTGRQPRPVLVPDGSAFAPEALLAAGPMAGELSRGMAVDKSLRHTDINDWYRALTTSISATTPQLKPVDPTTMAAPLYNPPSQPLAYPAPHAPATHYPPPAPLASAQDQTQAPVPVPPSAPRGSKTRLPLAAAAVVGLLAVAGGGALGFDRLTKSESIITGPTAGVIGDEAVYATSDGSARDWTVNGEQLANARSIAIVPSSAGEVRITVADSSDTDEIIFRVDEPSSDAPVIEGAGLVRVGDALVLQAVGVDAESARWTVNGENYSGPAIELQPSKPGTITVDLQSAEGSSTQRTITAIAGP